MSFCSRRESTTPTKFLRNSETDSIFPREGRITPQGGRPFTHHGAPGGGKTPYYLKRRVGFLWIIIFKITTFRGCPIGGIDYVNFPESQYSNFKIILAPPSVRQRASQMSIRLSKSVSFSSRRNSPLRQQFLRTMKRIKFSPRKGVLPPMGPHGVDKVGGETKLYET